MKSGTIRFALLFAVLALLFTMPMMESDADSGYDDIRVYIENDDGDYDLTKVSDVSTIKDAIDKAANKQGKEIVYNDKGNVSSVDGVESDDDNYWRVHQWLPLGTSGWGLMALDGSSDKYMESGASYCLHLSTLSSVDGTNVYSVPDFKPESKGYVFVRFANGFDGENSQVKATFTADVRAAGFWLEGEGSNMGEVLKNAMESNGLDIELSSGIDGNGNDLQCWIVSMCGLGDEELGDGTWSYWSQWTWVDNQWYYNDWTLGFYDPAVYKYVECIYLISTPDIYSGGYSIDKGGPEPNPNDGIECIKMTNKVQFRSEGRVIYTQYVSYGDVVDSSKIPEPTAPEGKTFDGWGDITKPIVRDTAFDAKFTSEVKHTVRFYTEGKAQLLYTVQVADGEEAVYPGTQLPSKPEDAQYTYTFSRWSADISCVRSDIDVTPIFTSTEKGAQDVHVTGVKIRGNSERTMIVGSTMTLTATVSPADATDKSVTWASSDTTVATVDSNGKVTARSEGDARITVTTVDGGCTDRCTITVVTPVDSVRLDKTSLEMTVGGTQKLTAEVKPGNASDKTVKWTSSNTKVATVDNKGSVKAIAEGNAVITATSSDGSKSATCLVTVRAEGSETVVEETDNSRTVATKTGDTWTSESILDSESVVQDGVVKVTVSTDEINDALNQIRSIRSQEGNMKSDIKVFSGNSSCNSAEFSMSSEALAKLKDVQGLTLSIESAAGALAMDESVTHMLSNLGKDVKISLSVSDEDDSVTTPSSVRIGVVVSIDIVGQGSQIHQLGGKANVTLPYTAAPGTDLSKIAVWYVNGANLEKIDGATYDAESGKVMFDTEHMSQWIVGVEVDQPAPSDDGMMMTIIVIVVVLIVIIAIVFIVVRKRY